MRIVDIEQAKADLTRLVAEAAAGEIEAAFGDRD